MEKHIITVLGPVSPEEMGITDAHSHVWIAAQENQVETAPVLNQERQILAELRAFHAAGGGGQIDCQPGLAGRDGSKLRSLSQASGVKIVANTGFHLEQYYPADAAIWQMDTDQAAAYFLSEIKAGLIETRDAEQLVFPGFIKIAARETLLDSPVGLITAAAIVSLETGYTIEMHTERGQAVEDLVDLFSRLGLAPERLVICHIDKRPDLGLHKELAQAGYLLEYDTFFRPKYNPEENVWPLVLAMVEAGLSASVALATDLADASLWARIGGGPGIVSFITTIYQRLEKMTDNGSIVASLMGGNIARRLAIINKREEE